jgi:hypothetical protein
MFPLPVLWLRKWAIIGPQDLVLLQVSRDVEVFAPLAASLLEVSDVSSASLVHYSFSNAHIFILQRLILH